MAAVYSNPENAIRLGLLESRRLAKPDHSDVHFWPGAPHVCSSGGLAPYVLLASPAIASETFAIGVRHVLIESGRNGNICVARSGDARWRSAQHSAKPCGAQKMYLKPNCISRIVRAAVILPKVAADRTSIPGES